MLTKKVLNFRSLQWKNLHEEELHNNSTPNYERCRAYNSARCFLLCQQCVFLYKKHPTSETCTGHGLRHFSKYGQRDSKKKYNLSRGQGAARFVATKATTFFKKFTMIGLAGIIGLLRQDDFWIKVQEVNQ